MSDFTFTDAVHCEWCGEPLGTSDKACDSCDPGTRGTHVFRHIVTDELQEVEAARSGVWTKLEEAVGDDWIEYEYCGSRERFDSFCDDPRWPTVASVPRVQLSTQVSKDL